jgi:hypothetical protein
LQAGSSTLTVAEAAAALLRGEGKKLQRKDRKAEIARIRAELGLADAARTPAVRLYRSEYLFLRRFWFLWGHLSVCVLVNYIFPWRHLGAVVSKKVIFLIAFCLEQY